MESTRQNNNINAINDVRMLRYELRNNLSREETKRIREKIFKKEAVYNFLIEKDRLTNKEKKVLKNIDRYLKNNSMHLKNLKKHFEKLQKYQYGIDYLLNEHNEEGYFSNNDTSAIQEFRKLLNERRSNLFCEETKRIRKKLRRIEAVYNVLKEKEQKSSLTSRQKNMLRNDERYLKDLKKDLDKLQKYQHNITYGIDYLFNELDEVDYYEPKEVKSAFDGSYILYESKTDEDARLSIDEYFDIIRPYLKDMIDSHKARNEWKIQLSMRIIFVSFTDANETREMHTKSDNITVTIDIETEDAINELFNTFHKRYQEGLETKMKTSSFTFEHIYLLEYHFHEISLNRGSSYIESPEWIQNKRVTINPKITKDNNCFLYAITAALNYQNIDHHSERISKLKPFINNSNWKGIEFPSHSKDWRKFECNNKTIALNMLYVSYNKEQIKQTYTSKQDKEQTKQDKEQIKQIRQAYISKHNDKHVNQEILLMIADEVSNWHYLAAKSISGFLRGITSNHNGDFYCLNCLHSYTTEKKLRKHGKICNNKEFCHPKIPDEDNEILKYIPGEKSLRVPFLIYADLECLLKKISTCSNNPDKSYTEKKAVHKPPGYSLVTCCSFDESKNERKY